MKAYRVYFDESEYSTISFAETANKARYKAFLGQTVFDDLGVDNSDAEEYLALKANKEPAVDDMEKASAEEIAYKLIKEAGWIWAGEIDETNVDDPEFRSMLHDMLKDI
ncbi:hypothetical protein FP435_04685 [Lactobacillus sp. PV037]|uniref:hypothetical protein n=1 Tax=Lactobacillus sp. PV037 TaxID=2594496 RepID=UPI00223F3C88|nr:hypothetical protein [Lactobacillus sp. PV037]QNQ83788.1 hypothetical protein FP435_04685 [Lactobacillus sp. PV037]